MKKKLLLLLLIIPFKVDALSVESIYIDAEADISGTLQIKELIKVKDQNSDFILNVFYKDKSLMKFNSKKESLYGSDIYNGSSVEVLKAGIVDSKYNLKDIYADDFLDNVNFFKEVKSEDKKEYYEITLDKKDKENIYYIEYNVYNVAVEHNDCAEIYYKFMKHFKYDASEVKIVTHLAHTSELFEVWAHGNKNTVVTKDTTSSVMMSEITNYKKDTYVDNRIIYDKDIFSINVNKSKKSDMKVISTIKEIENERNENTSARNTLGIIFGLCVIILILLVVIYIFYKKIKLNRKR